ncbi:uncharacterized protein LOC130807737 [Amaranthus tricolor]|uniref:uncharacterized protein LOC130807737 n=1 Tax=Amaranthus tricolor TaxID=29722 RepID=UPI00258D53C6|nr:uncharacterized protein LOC130807737 [Amaranthus tricolor]
MSCNHCCSSPVYLVSTQKNYSQNCKTQTKLCCQFSKNRRLNNKISKVGVFALKVESFTSIAVAKPADISVLIQTSALLISVYLIANFVVPQFISKSFELDKEAENEKTDIDSVNDRNSKTGVRGFNSTKPK